MSENSFPALFAPVVYSTPAGAPCNYTVWTDLTFCKLEPKQTFPTLNIQCAVIFILALLLCGRGIPSRFCCVFLHYAPVI